MSLKQVREFLVLPRKFLRSGECKFLDFADQLVYGSMLLEGSDGLIGSRATVCIDQNLQDPSFLVDDVLSKGAAKVRREADRFGILFPDERVSKCPEISSNPRMFMDQE